jgi:protein-disulfide isomerase
MAERDAAIKAEFDAIRAEMRKLRDEAAGPAPDQRPGKGNAAANLMRLNVSGYPVQGHPKANLVMVEFTDFQCPYCARYHAETYPVLKKTYIETQRMRYVSVDFPLDFHGLAIMAAEAAHCGDQQGQYWPVFERLYKVAPRIDRPNLLKVAEGLGLNPASFKDCLDSDAMQPKVKRGLASGASLGVTGTPTFLIGLAEGNVVKGRMIVGAYPTAVFEEVIRAHLGN